jgi:leucyl-tRNA synthetase
MFLSKKILNVAQRNRSSKFSSQCRILSSSSSQNTSYDHLSIEKKWQEYWDTNEVFKTRRRPGNPKKYVLDMFPYPSGSGLHVGHPEGYTATDIMARYWRMKDFDVLHPMGWDAFGLPAEQHAINTGTHPSVTTYENIATFKRQLKSLGFSYDWDRELSTTDDKYVRWTQWIFLQLFKKGLASQKDTVVNWCPELGTVLANEEIIDGLSERGGFPIIRQPLRQWILHITQYADRLEDGLKGVNWPDGTMISQKQWIGRSQGASIKFNVVGHTELNIDVFTTRVDTLMGVTYVVVAPESPIVDSIVTDAQRAAVATYVQSAVSKSDMERTSTGKEKGKTGVNTGAFAIHPISGEKVPIWVADYVLASYGTGCVMAVPAHDERDFEFAQKMGLDIKQVILPKNNEKSELPFCDHGILCNSEEWNGISSLDAQQIFIEKLTNIGAGGEKITYKLRDWVFSRQRYWGEPIPIYFPVEILSDDGLGSPIDGVRHHIDYDSPIAVPEEELPLRLPEMEDFHPGGNPEGCLARAKDWRYFQKNGQWFARETNTMPQWAGSCWYYMRFADPHNDTSLIGKEESSWLPVDLYVGGSEHAVLHLLYARFWHQVLYDLGIVDHTEPFSKLVHQGIILGSDGEKMSKSRGNVVNPDDVVQKHGADALRLYEMFMGPLEAVKPWQTDQMSGVVRFREKVYALVNEIVAAGNTNVKLEGDIEKAMHKTIKGVTGDIDRLAFNTAISKMMMFTNTLKEHNSHDLPLEAVRNLVLLLSPVAPHVAEECWELLGNKKTLAYETWPEFDEALCLDDTSKIVVQINGKMRGEIQLEDINISQNEIIELARNQPKIAKWLVDADVKKVIYVPGKILNIVIGKK